jgi:hypothetical protein
MLGVLAALFLACSAGAAELRGVVVKADPNRKVFTIEGRGGKRVRGLIVTFAVDKDTQIRRGEEAGTMADLSVGQRVRVTYDDQGNGPVALVVRVQQPLSAVLPALGLQPAGNGPPPSPQPQPLPLPLPADANTVAGVARHVGVTDREIVVVAADGKGGETETTIEVPADTKISRDQKPARLEDLKEGQSVVVHMEQKDGKFVAQSIDAGAVQAPAATPAPQPKSDKARVQRLRMILKMVDFYLQQMDRQ